MDTKLEDVDGPEARHESAAEPQDDAPTPSARVQKAPAAKGKGAKEKDARGTSKNGAAEKTPEIVADAQPPTRETSAHAAQQIAP